MYYSNATPGPRFHDMQRAERDRLRRIERRALNTRARAAAADLAAVDSRAERGTPGERAERDFTRILVAGYFARGGLVDVVDHRGNVVARHHGAIAPGWSNPTSYATVRGFAVRDLTTPALRADAHRQVNGALS